MKLRKKLQAFLVKAKATRLGEIWDSMKKPFNICWKGGLALFFIAMSITLIESLWDTCSDRLGMTHYYWGDEDLAGNIEIQHFSDDLCATYNKRTEKRMSPKVKWISGVPDRDSLTVFCDKDGKRGFLNVYTGKIEIQGQYSHAWHFSEGLAAVVGENGKVGFIDKDNKLVIPMEFDYVPDYDYLFVRDHCIMIDKATTNVGVIDKEGNVVVPLEYSKIEEASEYYDTWYVGKDDKCGLLGPDMNFIFEVEYDNVDVSALEGSAYLTKGDVKQLVAFDGTVVEPFVVDTTWPMSYIVKTHPSEADEYQLHPYLIEFSIDYNKRGVMDSRTGKVVIPALYTDVEMVSKDLILADLGYSEESILFNTRGEKIYE